MQRQALLDQFYPTVQKLAKKRFFDKKELNTIEEKQWEKFLKIWESIECGDLCPDNICRFAGPTPDWVLFLGHEDLCELIYSHMYNNDEPPKSDMCAQKHLRLPGSGFSRQ